MLTFFWNIETTTSLRYNLSPLIHNNRVYQAYFSPSSQYRLPPQDTITAWSLVLFWSLGILLIAWIGYEGFTTRVITEYPIADYWEHTAVLRALIEDGLMPAAPHLGINASSPRYMPHYLLIALGALALSLDALGAIALAGVVNMGLLVVGCYLLFRTLFQDRRAPLYGLLVMLGSWYQGWHYSNVYQLGYLPSVAGYPSQAAIGLSLIGFAIGIRVLRARQISRIGLMAICLLSFYELLTHPLTAMILFSGLGLMGISWPGISLHRRFVFLGSVLAGGLLTLVWPHFSVFQVILGTGGGGNSWIARSVSQLVGGTERKLHEFYSFTGILKALGAALLGIWGSLYFIMHRRRLAFVGLGAAIMVLPFIVNTFMYVPLGHRFILLTIFYLQIALVWMLLRLTPGFNDEGHEVLQGAPAWRRVLAGATVAAVLLGMTIHNIGFARDRMDRDLRDREEGKPSEVVLFAKRVAKQAGEHAVILGDPSLLWPLPTFGPKVVVGEHINPLIPDYSERMASTHRFFQAGVSQTQRQGIIDRYGVTHVLVSSRVPRDLLRFLVQHAEPPVRLSDSSLFRLRE